MPPLSMTKRDGTGRRHDGSAVALGEVVAEAAIDVAQVVGQHEGEAERFGDLQLLVPQDRKGEFVPGRHDGRALRQLGRDHDQRSAENLDVGIYGLQSVQLMLTVGSPTSSEEGENQRAAHQKLLRRDAQAVMVGELERWHGRADLDDAVEDARLAKVPRWRDA